MIRLVLALIFSGWITGCGASTERGQTVRGESVRGQIELSEAFTGDYALIDMHHIPAKPDRFAGKPALVYFGFTACPDVCPTALGVMSATLNELGPRADNIQPLFIALDAERDTPAMLAAYLEFEPRILGLTGDADQIDAAKAGFKVYSERQALPDSALRHASLQVPQPTKQTIPQSIVLIWNKVASGWK